eukprot:g2524.t1
MTISNEHNDPRIAKWLHECAPIIMQPEIDIERGYGLKRVYFDFKDDGTCDLSLCFGGEATYCALIPRLHNTIATFFYRSFNYYIYDRTADVNNIKFHGITFEGENENIPKWTHLSTTDYASSQSWSRGDCCCAFPWFTVMTHYKERIPANKWETRESRPIVWLATSNHLMSERNTNENTDFPGGWREHTFEDYGFHFGSRQVADDWAKDELPVFTNFFTLCRCCKADKNSNKESKLHAETKLLSAAKETKEERVQSSQYGSTD